MYINVSTDARIKMARTLARFLKEHADLEVKHTLANKAVAALFGLNEHSLAAAIKSKDGVQLEVEENDSASSTHACSVAGCDNSADVEVRLYDVYLLSENSEIFDKLDHTCPYLCSLHVDENERKAKGERKPRGVTVYPYTNKERAQGFTTYRRLKKSDPVLRREVGEASSDLLKDFGKGWTMQEALNHTLITFVRRESNTFVVLLGNLKTEISITLEHEGDYVNFVLSHVIKTPVQIGPYRTSRPYNDTPGSALHQAITSLTQYYEMAVGEGHQPQESWLVSY
jgi:CxxC motif-containing protein